VNALISQYSIQQKLRTVDQAYSDNIWTCKRLSWLWY